LAVPGTAERNGIILKDIEIYSPVSHYDIPLADLRAQHPDRRLVVGVAIFRRDPSDGKKKLLLVQRVETEDSFPLMYEIPGGHAEDEDASILSTVVRETREETGLTVCKIVAEFQGFEYEAKQGPSLQINFIVEVGLDDVVKLNPDEHCALAWIAPGDDLSHLALTGSMRKVVADALEFVSV